MTPFSILFLVASGSGLIVSPGNLQRACTRGCLSGVQMQHGGKGFGGGEATRDPAPTYIDPNDPKGKQQAIHKVRSDCNRHGRLHLALRTCFPFDVLCRLNHSPTTLQSVTPAQHWQLHRLRYLHPLIRGLSPQPLQRSLLRRTRPLPQAALHTPRLLFARRLAPQVRLALGMHRRLHLGHRGTCSETPQYRAQAGVAIVHRRLTTEPCGASFFS